MSEENTENNTSQDKLFKLMQTEDHLPLHDIFKELTDLYHKKNPGTQSKHLAALLNTRPQSLSQWKTGSDPRRRPPWRAILLLAKLCKRQILIHPDGIKLQRLRRWSE